MVYFLTKNVVCMSYNLEGFTHALTFKQRNNPFLIYPKVPSCSSGSSGLLLILLSLLNYATILHAAIKYG